MTESSVGSISRARQAGPRSVEAAAARVCAGMGPLNKGSFDWKEIFSSRDRMTETLLILAPAMFLVAGSLWFALQLVEPAPPKRFVLATELKTGASFAVGRPSCDELAKSGITLEVRATKGSVENISLLNDPALGVQAALITGWNTNGSINSTIVSAGRPRQRLAEPSEPIPQPSGLPPAF